MSNDKDRFEPIGYTHSEHWVDFGLSDVPPSALEIMLEAMDMDERDFPE